MILPHVSASQIQTFRNCPRLWDFEKVAKLSTKPEKSFQGFGKDVHRVLELHEIFGAVPMDAALALGPEAMRRAATAYQHLPEPGTPGMLLEHPIEFPSYEGGPLVIGYVDLIRPPRMDAGGVIIGIDDHKTTSDFRWAKSSEQLKTNVQMMLYAYWAFRVGAQPWFPVPPTEAWRAVWEEGVDVVELAHNYILSKGRLASKRVETSVEWPHVAKQYAGICGSIQEMVDIAAREPDPMSVPGDETGAHCRAYGGCEFREKCPEANRPQTLVQLFGPGKRPTGADGGMNMATMDELKARLAARMGAPAATTPEAPPAPVASAAPAAPVAPTPPADAPKDVQIAPPDAPSRVNEPGDVAKAEEAAAPAKRRGRPPKAVATAEAASTAASVAKAVTPPGRGARVLYINAKQSRGPHAAYDPTAWTAWMSDLLSELHKSLNVLDYRLVEFGKGRGALTAALRAGLSTAPEVCFVDPLHPEAQDFLAVAIPQADEVNVGGR